MGSYHMSYFIHQLAFYFVLLTIYFICSGFNVINVKHGNIKFVPYLMVEEMIVDKLNTLALTAIFKK